LHALAFLAVLLDEAFFAKTVHQVLDARLGALAPVRVAVVQADHRLGGHQQVFVPDERFHHYGFMGLVAQAATRQHLPAETAVFAPHGDNPQILHQGLGAIGFAAGNADLELARQVLG